MKRIFFATFLTLFLTAGTVLSQEENRIDESAAEAIRQMTLPPQTESPP